MELPSYLINIIKEGRAVLFLGAGASYGATDQHGNMPPDGDRIKEMLADRFLGGAMKDNPLSIVAELAMHESSRLEVQEFIRQLFENLSHAPFHELVPSFVWKAIATTNYDLVLERAYQSMADG